MSLVHDALTEVHDWICKQPGIYKAVKMLDSYVYTLTQYPDPWVKMYVDDKGIRFVMGPNEYLCREPIIPLNDPDLDIVEAVKDFFHDLVRVAGQRHGGFTAVYHSQRNMYVRVRDGGSTPIKTFESSVAPTRSSDA